MIHIRTLHLQGESFVFSAIIAGGYKPEVPVDLEWCTGVMRRGLEIGYEAKRMTVMMRSLPHECLQVTNRVKSVYKRRRNGY